jgi:tetratricopeptide (TPR) repeat protein
MITLYDGKPVPKVIDFGVAKATEQKLTERTLFTQYGTMVGTLEYMSPEQAEMSALGVDTRSDIYSLGVLLYELLTGSTPLTHKRMKEAAYAEILRMIKEEEPPRPSTRLSDSGEALASISANRHTEPAKLTKLVRGELDWIVMKCLEKDRNRRYETANGFAADVQRYLADEPVQACPPSVGYRLRKFARRNKGPVLAASLVVLALVVGILGTTWGMIRATHAEAKAVDEAGQKATALREREAALETAKQNAVEAQKQEALAKQNEKIANEQRIEAEANLKDALDAVDKMLTRVAENHLTYVPQMEPIRRDLLQDALKFYQKFLEKKRDDPVIRREAALAYRRVGRIHNRLGQLQEAEKAYRTAIVMLQDLGVSSLPASVRSDFVGLHFDFAWTLGLLGKREERLQTYERAVEIAARLAADDPNHCGTLVNARNVLAWALVNHRPNEAEKMLRENLRLADDASNRAGAHRALGEVFYARGRLKEAEETFRQALKHAEKAFADQPSSDWAQSVVANDLRRLASVLAANQNLVEAEKLLRRAILLFGRLATDFPAGPHHRRGLANAEAEHAQVLKKLGRTIDAENAYRRSADLYEKLAREFRTFPEYPQAVFDQRSSLGQLFLAAGRVEDAHQVFRQTAAQLEEMAEVLPTQLVHWRGLVASQIELGRLLAAAGKGQESEAAFQKAVEVLEKLEAEFADKPELHLELAKCHDSAAQGFQRAARTEETEKCLRWAIRLREQQVSHNFDDYYWLSCNYIDLAHLLVKGRRSEEAEAVFTRAFAFYHTRAERAEKPHLTYYRHELGRIHNWRGRFLVTKGRLQEAENEHRQAMEIYENLVQAKTPGVMDKWHRGELYWTRENLAPVLWRNGREAEAIQTIRDAIPLADQLHADFPLEGYHGWLAQANNYHGWFLATAANEKLRNPAAAVALSSKAVELAPKKAAYWTTLGVARYRAASWNSALEALKKAEELSGGKDLATNALFIAMSAWQLGNKEDALSWYGKAVAWMEKSQPMNDELQRFQAEAKKLLGVKEKK